MKLTAKEISEVLAALPGCLYPKAMAASKPCGTCLQCRAREALMGKPPAEGHSITIGSLLSHRTNEGVVEFIVNEERLQFPLDKAREIYEMFGGAIEAAVTDQIVYEVFRDHGMPENAIMVVLSELREKRQGSKGVVHAS